MYIQYSICFIVYTFSYCAAVEEEKNKTCGCFNSILILPFGLLLFREEHMIAIFFVFVLFDIKLQYLLMEFSKDTIILK